MTKSNRKLLRRIVRLLGVRNSKIAAYKKAVSSSYYTNYTELRLILDTAKQNAPVALSMSFIWSSQPDEDYWCSLHAYLIEVQRQQRGFPDYRTVSMEYLDKVTQLCE